MVVRLTRERSKVRIEGRKRRSGRREEEPKDTRLSLWDGCCC